MLKIAINGFGRIGRMALRSIYERKLDLQVVAINDLGGSEAGLHLLRYDSAYGEFDLPLQSGLDYLQVGNDVIKFTAEKDPLNLPWRELGVDIVLECTGIFTNQEKASLHLQAGAKRVIISAPAKGEVDATLVMGVNHMDFDPHKHFVISNASCTTNCLAPVVKVLHEKFGIVNGLMNTVHSYTADQNLVDGPHRDLRRARAAAQSIVPTTTGAAQAVALVIPDLKGKLKGLSLRVPTLTVSLVDFTFQSEKSVTVEEVNQALQAAANSNLKGILAYSEEELVSIDYRQNSHSSIVDAKLTQLAGDKLVKILAWYDNEWGYACRLVDLADYLSQKI